MDKLEITKRELVPDEFVDSDSSFKPSRETLLELGEFLKKRHDELKEIRQRSDWEREKGDAFESYHMREQSRDLPWDGASNLTCWIPRMVVDSVHAFRMQAIFGNGKTAKVKVTKYPKDAAETAKRSADYMTYILEHEAKFYTPMDEGDLNAEKYGIGYLEPRYVREKVIETVEIEKEVTLPPSIDPVTQKYEIKTKKETKTEKRERTVFDGTKVESLPVESILISPFISTIEKAVKDDVVFKDFTITVQRLKERGEQKNGFYKDAVEAISSGAIKRRVGRLSDLEQAKANNDGFYMDKMIDKDVLDFSEAHLWYDIDNDGKNEKITATFEPQTGQIVKVSLSKCRIVALNPHPIDGRFWGEGDYKILKQFCMQWESINNTRVNAGQWENSPFGFYKAGGRLNPQTITFTPGQFYPVDNPQEVSFAQTPSVRSSYFQEEQLLLIAVERLIGLPEPILPPKSGKTSATQNQQQAQVSGIRFSNPLNRVLMSVKELMTHIWELNRECAPKEKEYFIVGAGNTFVFDKMMKDAYQMDVQFDLDIETMFDKQQARDTALLVWRLFRQSPNFVQHPQVGWELDTRVLKALDYDIPIPKPPQANAKSPYEMIQMVREGKNPDPVLGEDYDEHLRQYMALLDSDAMKEWTSDEIKGLIVLIDKTTLLKKVLEKSQLNQSGLPNLPPGLSAPGGQPGMTLSRNPADMMNRMRVGPQGGGANAPQDIQAFTGTKVPSSGNGAR